MGNTTAKAIVLKYDASITAPEGYRLTITTSSAIAKAAYTVNSVVLPEKADAPAFVLKYQGYLDIPADGIYSFYLNCEPDHPSPRFARCSMM
ncbi:hypothetical protein [Pedobacter hartonius]|uniref:Uncharacterized protein n=1 Tax=Pedobacter hartonius TaxID=425514 RepID=A0A1H4AX35_9SPHI|nr:hypothetical protein [Pedobacter hartonius]SEA40212.1 hypothetical protein SAMN05443550_103117 [Pedobacter hartonius]